MERMHLRVFPACSSAKHTPRQGNHYHPSGVCLNGKSRKEITLYKSTKEHKATPKRCELLAQNAGVVFIPA